MPTTWEGHPLRKEYPARATEFGPFTFTEEDRTREEEALKFVPEEWGMKRESEDAEFMFLNLGPDHPGTHGLLRLNSSTRWRRNIRNSSRYWLPPSWS